MKPKQKQRVRSTNLEVVGGVPHAALRKLREIAADADLPLARVFADVLAIGVSVVSDPAESPYASLIAFRAGLAAKQAELENVAQHQTLQVAVGGIPEQGDPGVPPGSALVDDRGSLSADVGTEEAAAQNRFAIAVERSRFGSEIEEDPG